MWKGGCHKGACHVILLLAKLVDMYLYMTATFPHQPLKSLSKVAFLHRFHCTPFIRDCGLIWAFVACLLDQWILWTINTNREDPDPTA